MDKNYIIIAVVAIIAIIYFMSNKATAATINNPINDVKSGNGKPQSMIDAILAATEKNEAEQDLEDKANKAEKNKVVKEGIKDCKKVCKSLVKPIPYGESKSIGKGYNGNHKTQKNSCISDCSKGLNINKIYPKYRP